MGRCAIIDLSVAKSIVSVSVENIPDLAGDLVDLRHAVHRAQDALCLVVSRTDSARNNFYRQDGGCAPSR